MFFLAFVTLTILFWPRYDLEVALEPGPSRYEIVETGFYSLKNCRESAQNYKKYDWAALKYSAWGKIFNKYRDSFTKDLIQV